MPPSPSRLPTLRLPSSAACKYRGRRLGRRCLMNSRGPPTVASSPAYDHRRSDPSPSSSSASRQPPPPRSCPDPRQIGPPLASPSRPLSLSLSLSLPPDLHTQTPQKYSNNNECHPHLLRPPFVHGSAADPSPALPPGSRPFSSVHASFSPNGLHLLRPTHRLHRLQPQPLSAAARFTNRRRRRVALPSSTVDALTSKPDAALVSPSSPDSTHSQSAAATVAATTPNLTTRLDSLT